MASDPVFEDHRDALFGLAYRMLGSAADAEDVVQDAYLRWAGEERSAVRVPLAYLRSVVTRLCIDRLRRVKARREEYVGPWLPEPLITTEGAPQAARAELAESLSLAFLAVLETLGPVERAVFLLREAFEYDFAEIAAIVGKEPANCRQILRRARARVRERRPRYRADPVEHGRVTRSFLAAVTTGDADALVGLLADHVRLTADGGGRVPSATVPLDGPDRVSAFLLGISRQRGREASVEFVEVNGLLAAVILMGGELDSVLQVDVLDGVVRGVQIVRNPDKLGRVRAAL